jgi:hypothetical protein
MAMAPARRRSAELTRRKLLDAGRAAFATLGHDGVNLQRDILRPAGVSLARSGLVAGDGSATSQRWSPVRSVFAVATNP